ncbi:MAG: hypothetical protein JRE40_06425 [Deltaproteobacteria bacterium]|nr:hypothetical protein [Deltaproteobacteria bacterium]
MTTVNKRVYGPQASVINGVDAGGLMTATIDSGYDNVMRTSPDGLAVPVVDREVQFVRGSITSQDWIHLVDLITGAVGTYVFYERKSGVAAETETGYILHTITKPVIHNARLSMNQKGYMTVSFDFECRAADETATILNMWTMTDSQAAPTYVSAARGGWRVETCVHGEDPDDINIYHVTAFDFALTMQLLKACNDADVGYTAVDAREDGMRTAGSISFGDASIKAVTFELKCQELALAAAASLVITVTQSAGATSKVITIARAIFATAGANSGAQGDYSGYRANFEVTNDPDTPLTLDGDNKIIMIV